MYIFTHFFIPKHFLSTRTPPPFPVLSCAEDQSNPDSPRPCPQVQGFNTQRPRLQAPVGHHGHTVLWSLSPRASPPEWPLLQTYSEGPLLSNKSWPPSHLPSETSLWPQHLSTQNRERSLSLVIYILTLFWKELEAVGSKLLTGGKESTISQKWLANGMLLFAWQIKGQDHSTWARRQRDRLCYRAGGMWMLSKPCENRIQRIFTKRSCPSASN